MPIIKSAKKALRQTRRRTTVNKARKEALRAEIKKFKKTRKSESLSVLYALADKLAKRGIIHPNKAKRIKSKAAKL